MKVPENYNYYPINVEDTIIPCWVYVDQYGRLAIKIKYPKVGRSHFYSLKNYIDELFDLQYPEMAYCFWFQSRFL
jgi:hypothetical protein